MAFSIRSSDTTVAAIEARARHRTPQRHFNLLERTGRHHRGGYDVFAVTRAGRVAGAVTSATWGPANVASEPLPVQPGGFASGTVPQRSGPLLAGSSR